MGKIALLVSREEMLYHAHNILQEQKFEISEMRVISTENAVAEAREAVSRGATIIIARGLQASLIKQYTDIPVAEIVLTAQEMALLVIKAKQIVKKNVPVIAVVGFENMFCDMSYFDSIYGIELQTYYVKKGAELAGAARQAMEDGADLIIGGDTVVSLASEAGVPSLFLSMTEDSIRNAFSVAESMDFAMGAQKRSEVQMETLLDYSFNGMARMDAKGRILSVNPILEDMLGKSKEELTGTYAVDVMKDIPAENLRQILEEGQEDYSLFMRLNGVSVFAMLAPIVVDGRVEGAILTCHRMKKRLTVQEESSRKRHSRGFIALGQFEDIEQRSAAMQACIRQAKLYALSDKPVAIFGEPGTEKRLIAQSIHNAGLRREEPFVDISCDGIGDELQLEMIFGEKGAVVQAGSGTLLLEDVDWLTRANQYRLYQLIRYKLRMGAQVTQHLGVDVRVMVTCARPLWQLAREGRIREDLYYLLEGLTVRIPPLKERREDLTARIEAGVRECCEHYSRYHVLTKGAMKVLAEYPWPGNLFQVENFCERLILTAGKRSLDEIAVRKMLEELYPGESGWNAAAEAGRWRDEAEAGRRRNEADRRRAEAEVDREMSRGGVADGGGWNPGGWDTGGGNPGGENPGAPGFASALPDEAARIAETLRRLRGNREKTAKALGMSKTTLWRRMKEYGIE